MTFIVWSFENALFFSEFEKYFHDLKKKYTGSNYYNLNFTWIENFMT